MNTEKKQYALLIQGSDLKMNMTSGIGTLRVPIVRLEDGGRKVRNPGSDDPFEDLQFSCQWDLEKNLDRTYGWDVTYRDVYSVDSGDAERMVKVFRHIEKVRNRFAVTPTTFGQFVALIAHGLGIEVAKRESCRQAHSSSYDENVYNDFTLQQAQYAIDDLIEQSREAQKTA